MTVGLEVDTDVVLLGGMVKMLYTCSCAGDGDAALNVSSLMPSTHLLNELCRATIGVSGLNNTKLDLVMKIGAQDEVAEEKCRKNGNFVAVEKAEGLAVTKIVVNNTVGIAVKAGSASVGCRQDASLCNRGREGLLGLYKVRTALRVKSTRLVRVGVDGFEREEVADVLLEVGNGVGSNTIRAVDVKWLQWSAAALIVSQKAFSNDSQ